MKCASMRTSPIEKFSSRMHFGMSACIWAANLVASPRYSRCSSCCGRSAIAPDYAKAVKPGSGLELAHPTNALIRDLAPSLKLVRTLAPAPDRRRQRLEHAARSVPAEARIGDALP